MIRVRMRPRVHPRASPPDGTISGSVAFWGAICSSRLEGPSSDCPGRAFTAVGTIPDPKHLRGAICAKMAVKMARASRPRDRKNTAKMAVPLSATVRNHSVMPADTIPPPIIRQPEQFARKRENGDERRGDRGCFPVTFWKK